MNILNAGSIALILAAISCNQVRAQSRVDKYRQSGAAAKAHNLGEDAYRRGVSVYKTERSRDKAKPHFEQAVKHFSDAIRIQPEWSSPYLYRGESYAELRMFAEATKDLNAAIRLGSLRAPERLKVWEADLLYNYWKNDTPERRQNRERMNKALEEERANAERLGIKERITEDHTVYGTHIENVRPRSPVTRLRILGSKETLQLVPGRHVITSVDGRSAQTGIRNLSLSSALLSVFDLEAGRTVYAIVLFDE